MSVHCSLCSSPTVFRLPYHSYHIPASTKSLNILCGHISLFLSSNNGIPHATDALFCLLTHALQARMKFNYSKQISTSFKCRLQHSSQYFTVDKQTNYKHYTTLTSTISPINNPQLKKRPVGHHPSVWQLCFYLSFNIGICPEIFPPQLPDIIPSPSQEWQEAS